jgi:biotin operon repressor
MKLPSFQFYPGDWMKDPGLRSVSLEARGLWIDMLCLLFEGVRRGYLQHATGKPVSDEQLARMTGSSSEQVSRLLRELEDSGVFSRTEHGTLYSRRMIRDERKRKACSEAGKKGRGNPEFHGTKDLRLTFKGPSKGASKQNPNPSSSSSTSYKNLTPLPPEGDWMPGACF